jgi:hypothetical protein
VRSKTYAYDQQTVSDKQTGLMWQRTTSDGGVTFDEGAAYCEGLAYASHSDWRLPTRIELLSIVDTSTQRPAIDYFAFPGAPADTFWTSTPKADSTWGGVWCVGFTTGYATGCAKADNLLARCVR